MITRQTQTTYKIDYIVNALNCACVNVWIKRQSPRRGLNQPLYRRLHKRVIERFLNVLNQMNGGDLDSDDNIADVMLCTDIAKQMMNIWLPTVGLSWPVTCETLGVTFLT